MFKKNFQKKVDATEESQMATLDTQSQNANPEKDDNAINPEQLSSASKHVISDHAETPIITSNESNQASLPNNEVPLSNGKEADSVQSNEAPLSNDKEADSVQSNEASPSPDENKQMQDDNHSKDQVKKGFSEYLFNILASVSLLTFLILAIIPLFSSNFSQNNTFYSINYAYVLNSFEQNYITTYEQMKEASQWLVPLANGNSYSVFPAYIWFISIVDSAQNLDKNILYAIVSILSAFIAVAGTYTLSLAIGLNNKVSFAAGLIFMSSFGFASMLNFKSVDFFWAGLLCFSLACLYRGWTSQKSYFMLLTGFILIAICTLTIGFNGLIIPLLSSIIFIICKGLFKRSHQKDAITGFALLLFILLAWFSSTLLFYDSSAYFKQLSLKLPLNLMLNTNWYMPAIFIVSSLIPWLFILVFAISKKNEANVKIQGVNRSGFIWIGICLFVTLLNIYVNDQASSSIIPIIPLFCIFFAKILTNLAPKNSNYFFSFVTGIFIIIGLSLTILCIPYLNELIANYMPLSLKNYVSSISNLYVCSFLWILASLSLIKFTKRSSPSGTLLITAVLFIVLMPPIIQAMTPEFATLMIKDKAITSQDAKSQGNYSIEKQVKAAPDTATPEAIAPDTAAPESIAPEAIAPDASKQDQGKSIIPNDNTEQNKPDTQNTAKEQSTI